MGCGAGSTTRWGRRAFEREHTARAGPRQGLCWGSNEWPPRNGGVEELENGQGRKGKQDGKRNEKHSGVGNGVGRWAGGHACSHAWWLGRRQGEKSEGGRCCPTRTAPEGRSWPKGGKRQARLRHRVEGTIGQPRGAATTEQGFVTCGLPAPRSHLLLLNWSCGKEHCSGKHPITKSSFSSSTPIVSCSRLLTLASLQLLIPPHAARMRHPSADQLKAALSPAQGLPLATTTAGGTAFL